MKETIFRKNEDIEAVKMGDELAMMNTKTGKYIVINEVGKDIWELINGINTESMIVKCLVDLYEVEEVVCKGEVKQFLDQLTEEKLILKV